MEDVPMSTNLVERNRRNRKRRASEALEDPPEPTFGVSHIPVERLWDIFTPTFRRYIELRWPGQDVDERMRDIRANTRSEEIIDLVKMGPAVLAEWRANRRSGPRQSISGSAIDTVMADSASERSSTAVATIPSNASPNTRRSATVLPDTEPQRNSPSFVPPPRAVRVTQTAETVKAEDTEMVDGTPGPASISTLKPMAPVPFVIKSALASVPAPIPTPLAVATPQAMASAAAVTVDPSALALAPAPPPPNSIPNMDLDLDPDVDQAIIYELRDKTMTEVFTLKQGNAKATSAYTWTMRSHAFDPTQEYTCYKLRSFETAAVKALVAQLPPNADDKMRAQAIARLPTTWPAKGRVLFVEINGQKSKAYGPKHFTPPTESIDITHDIQEGVNHIKFAQLNDQSAWTFAVFERRPYREELEEAAKHLGG